VAKLRLLRQGVLSLLQLCLLPRSLQRSPA
jgi:hypothetical protein